VLARGERTILRVNRRAGALGVGSGLQLAGDVDKPALRGDALRDQRRFQDDDEDEEMLRVEMVDDLGGIEGELL
jgi:hypothetical protein